MEQNILAADAGELTGKLLVFGGVYSNLQALEQLKKIADDAGIPPQNILCTGDVVGYCAQPEECVQAIKAWGIRAIAGNVEIQLRGGEDDCGCNFGEGSRCDLFSRQWYPYAQSKLSASSLSWMRQLPDHLRFIWTGRRVYLLHGSFFNTSEFVFRSTDWAVKQTNFDATGADLILAGHCGLPFSHEKNGRLWLNAGVVGMPANDGTPRVWCMTLEPNGAETLFQHHPFVYDNVEAARRMRENKLPREYSETLLSGLWDNCEILPEAETAQRGAALGFQALPYLHDNPPGVSRD
jgi:predicted phosphodiesterase